jgi:hypothetical protein
MKTKLVKIVAKAIPYDLLFDLLFWKITEKHNLRESGTNACNLCYHYFQLKGLVEKLQKNIQWKH